MTFPAGIETVVVTLGTFTSQGGSNAYSGTITFTPRAARYHIATRTPMPATPISVNLANGTSEVILVASDATGCDVTDVQYDVTFNLRGPDGARVTFDDKTIYLAADASPYDLDYISGVSPADPEGVIVTGAARDSEVVHLALTETITGQKTFSQPVTIPAPTSDDHAATKAYVDEHGGTGGTVSDATTGSKGIVQLTNHLGGTATAPTVPGLATKANTASPALTGTPTAPTAAAGTNTTQIATTAFVRTEVAAVVDSAPATLDTLNELAAALGDDSNYATATANALAQKAPLASPNLTGTPTAPTPAPGTNTNQIATAASVAAAVNGLAADSGVVHITGTETIGGAKTFGTAVSVPTPTAGAHAVTKAYADGLLALAPRTVSGTSDTLAATDSGRTVLCTNASDVTVTVPPNSTAAFPLGAEVKVAQMGTGQVTLAAGVGVTLDSPRGLKTALRYSRLTVTKIATDEWLVGGDTKTSTATTSGFGTGPFGTTPFGS